MTGSELSRRTVLKTGSAVAAATLFASNGWAADGAGQPSINVLHYEDVQLLDGPALAQFNLTQQALLGMNEDALLRPFRLAVGAAAPGPHFGGWYDPSPDFHAPANMRGFIPGHSFGQYISAMSRGYAATGDARVKAKVARLLAGFAPTIDTRFYDNYSLPAYTFDKTMIGLIDASAFAETPSAMKMLDAATDAVVPHLPGHALDRVKLEREKPAPFGWDETYTLPENLYLAAERGGGERYHSMARQYLLDASYFDPLSQGKNVLPGRHAYSHLNAFSSAMQAYFKDGSAKHLAAARNGLGFVLDQSFATGGWGPNEAFVPPGSGKLGDSLTSTHASFEGPCGTYGHFKIARYLMRATGDSRYGDSMERLLYNVALGCLPLKSDGTSFYYADYNEIGSKSYYEEACPCCSGTIGQLTADYGISAYLQDLHGLYVNLYIPSRAIWRVRGEPTLTLTQTGDYPLTDRVKLKVGAPRPVTMALRLRIPAWAGPNTAVIVNGGPLQPVKAGSFATINRRWRDGDSVELRIEMPLRLESVDAQHENRVALMQGPIALFGTGDRFSRYKPEELLSAKQRGAGSSEWVFASEGHDLVMKPFFAISGEPTRLYQMLV